MPVVPEDEDDDKLPMGEALAVLASGPDMAIFTSGGEANVATAAQQAIDRIALLEEALRPFAEAASHLHPAQPDDGLTLDGIEVRHWRQAAQALAETEVGGG